MSVLITGGGSGIGEGTARLFAARGAKVTISGRRRDKIEAVAASIGDACHAVVGDVTVQADREAMLQAAVVHGGKLDVLVNNAANMYRQAIAEYTEQVLQDAFNTNYWRKPRVPLFSWALSTIDGPIPVRLPTPPPRRR
jgi:3-oxoacyl-[acyl-carrier protein] reductase